MECKLNQSTDLSDYSKFYKEDKENMIELFFNIFKDLKMNDSIDSSSDLSTIDCSESENDFSFNSTTDLKFESSEDLPSFESSEDLPLESSEDLSLELLEDLKAFESSEDLPSLESSEDLKILESSTDLSENYEIYDLYQEPVIDFVFDESQIYRDDNSNNLFNSIDLPTTLTTTFDSITDKALALEKLYNRIRNKINDFKYQNDEFKRCISALNRIVIQLDQHSSKLCLLSKLSNLKYNIKGYKEFLTNNQCTLSANSIQQMIDLFYTSYLEFDTTLKNCVTTEQLMNHSNKLQSNLEYLRNVYPQYRNLKKELPSEFRRLRTVIRLLRYEIVRDLIEVIIELSSDECYQLFNGFTQHNLLFSFKRLLRSIS